MINTNLNLQDTEKRQKTEICARVVVVLLNAGWKVMGLNSISHVGLSSLTGSYLEQGVLDSVGKLGPHSQASSTSQTWRLACELISLIVPTICLENTVSPLPFYWVKGVCVFSCNWNLHFWQNDQGLLHATAVKQEWIRYWNEWTQKVREENSPAFPAYASTEIVLHWKQF